MFTIGRGKRLLGICVGERSLVVTEVACGGEGLPTARSGEFVYPEDLNLDMEKSLGRALGQYLALQGFSAKSVVFGVPAGWLVMRSCQVPPTDAETAASLVWLEATEHTSRELGEVVYDFTGPTSEAQTTNVLILGSQKTWLDRLHALADGARLKIIAITPTGIAVGAASASYVENAQILSIRSDGVELIIQDNTRIRSLRHIGQLGAASALIAQLRRAGASTARESTSIAIWDDAGVGTEFLAALEDFAGSRVQHATWRWTEIADAAQSAPAHYPGLAAAALTIPFRSDLRPEIDFLHPRLAPPKAGVVSRGNRVVVGVCLALLAVIVGFADIANLHRQISSNAGKLQVLEPALAVARPFVTSMQFAESYRTSKPSYLACLKDITLAIAPGEKTYLTRFNLGQDMRGTVTGRSDIEQNVLNFLDKLNLSGRFVELHRTLDGHAGRGAGNEVVFSVNFTYRPAQ